MGLCVSKACHAIDEEIRERTLSSAFDDFFRNHCEIGNGLHVLDMEMQAAICDYFDMMGLAEMRMQWLHDNTALLFDHFGKVVKERNGIYVTGVRAHRILVGVRIVSWPQVKIVIC